MRALRFDVLKVPKPTKVTASPFFSDLVMLRQRRRHHLRGEGLGAAGVLDDLRDQFLLVHRARQAAALTVSCSIALSSVASFAGGGWPKSTSGCSTATSGVRPFSLIATLGRRQVEQMREHQAAAVGQPHEPLARGAAERALADERRALVADSAAAKSSAPLDVPLSVSSATG